MEGIGALIPMNTMELIPLFGSVEQNPEFMEMLLGLLGEEEQSEEELLKLKEVIKQPELNNLLPGLFLPENPLIPKEQIVTDKLPKEKTCPLDNDLSFQELKFFIQEKKNEPLEQKDVVLPKLAETVFQETHQSMQVEPVKIDNLWLTKMSLRESTSFEAPENLSSEELPEIKFSERVLWHQEEGIEFLMEKESNFVEKIIPEELNQVNQISTPFSQETVPEKIELSTPNLVRDLPEVIFKEIKPLLEVNGEKEIVIHLKPKELGRLVVELSVEEGAVSVKFLVEQPVVRSFLESNLDNLRQSFLKQDIPFAGLNVDIGGEQLKQSQSDQEPIWELKKQNSWSQEKKEISACTDFQPTSLRLSAYDYLV